MYLIREGCGNWSMLAKAKWGNINACIYLRLETRHFYQSLTNTYDLFRWGNFYLLHREFRCLLQQQLLMKNKE